MFEFISKRILGAIPLLFALVTLTFFFTSLMPGDAATAITDQSPLASAEDVAEIRASMGLDRPFLEQYVDYMGGVLQGDLGRSLFTSTPVTELISSRIVGTFALALVGTMIAVVIGVGAGIIAGLRPHGVVDRVVTGLATLGIAMPNFWVGLLLVWVFAVTLGWLPAGGFGQPGASFGDKMITLILPGIALGTSAAAHVARQMRGSLIGVMEGDLVTALDVRGLPRRRVVLRHALRNAAIPVLTVVGLLAARMLGGAIVIEQVFAFPGIGSLAVTAVNTRDIPVVQGVALTVGLVVVVINIVTDVVHVSLDPAARVQLS